MRIDIVVLLLAALVTQSARGKPAWMTHLKRIIVNVGRSMRRRPSRPPVIGADDDIRKPLAPEDLPDTEPSIEISASAGPGEEPPITREAPVHSVILPVVLVDNPFDLGRILSEQEDLDALNYLCAPKPRFTYECSGDQHDAYPEVGAFIASSSYSSVFVMGRSEAAGMPRPRDIKYQADCDQASAVHYDVATAVHPLFLDYSFGKAAAVHRLSAEPLFISPSSPMSSFKGVDPYFSGPNSSPSDVLNKLQFDIFDDRIPSEVTANCQLKGAVRYMVMERVGKCLNAHKLAASPVSPPEAIRIGIEVIGMLQRLHNDAGIIHGDLHSGNVCRRLEEPHSLVFIDFGFASSVTQERDGAGARFEAHPALSPWELEGHATARRDDVFKAVFLTAELMIGKEIYNKCWVGEADRIGWYDSACLLTWKTEGGYFKAGTADPIRAMVMDEGKSLPIHERLKSVHDMVMALTSVHATIDYEGIVTGLNDVLRLMDPVRVE